jgi:histidine triad (HIT) family protein
MEDCLFCKIANHKISSEIIYEDETALAFLDIFPRSKGHAVIIPKVHVENIIDLSEELIGPVFKSVKIVTEMINKALSPGGFTIGINQGRISGQSINHLHIHVIPRFDGDGGGSLHSVVNNPSKESLGEVKFKILNKK